MRLFTQLIFDQTVIADASNNEVVSSAEFNNVLGKAYDVVLEIEVEAATGAAPAITVYYKHSNSGKGFVALPVLISGATLTALPYRNVKAVTGPLGALGQVSVKLAAATDTARVRIWATGLSH